MFSVLSPERRIAPGHPLRRIKQMADERKRKRVEEIFGWMKTVGNFRRTRFLGLRRTQLAAAFVAAAYNLLRICRLVPATA